MNYIVFNGKDLSDFGVYIDASVSFSNPEKDYELITIPGRNGQLSIYNNRFNDVEISFPCAIRENFVSNYRDLMSFLNSVTGYKRLETSREPDEFREALFIGDVEPTTSQFIKGGRFTLRFRCHPQRFMKIGENYVTITHASVSNPKSIFNPTNQPSKPLIRMHGVGTVNIGGTSYTLSTLASTAITYIDCDLCDVYGDDGTNRNSHFAGNFPQINVGNNTIVAGSDGVLIDIMPRWFEI